MDKLNSKILLISLMLILILSVQGAAAASDDGNLTSENIDLSICDNEEDMDSDSILTAANSEDILGEVDGSFGELQDLIDTHYGRDLTLNKSYTYNNDKEITITGPITIYGNGKTINANDECFIFKIRGDNVVLQDIVFTNGNATDGAAIIWYGNNGTLTNCSFTNNNAVISGGAVWWSGENGTLTNCNFNNNTASYGGGVFWRSDWDTGKNGKLTNCSFTNNYAHFGGAVNWNGENGTLTNCSFTNNSALENAGALLWGGDNGNLANCSFTNNNASFIGAVEWTGNNGTLTNCNFTNNNATHGGAVLWQGESGNVTNCNFNNNNAREMGGAVHWNGDNGKLTDCNFNNNTADWDDGAVHWFGKYGTLTNCNFNNNNANHWGGAISWIREYGTLTNCNFTNNNATERGGAIRWSGSYGTLTNCNFTNNNATELGGAIYWDGWQGNVINSVFLNNKVKSTSLTVNNGTASLTLTLKGGENYINAIYGFDTLMLSDVTYWNGKITTGSSPSQSDCEAGQNITIEVYDSSGNLVDNVTIVTDLNGQARYDFTHLSDGNYTYVAYHPDDAYYTYINATGNFTLKRDKTNITISVNNATYGEYPVANITADVAGNYTLIIANKTYDPVVFTQQDVDNHKVKQVAVDELLNAKEGYVASVHFKGNEFYSTETQETLFNIEKISSTIVITNYISPITIGKDSGVFFEITSKLGNHTVTLCINGSEISAYDFENNIGGFVIPEYNLTSKGTYNITVQCQGNNNYNASNIASCIITVNGINVTMNATGSTVYYGENATITVTGLPGDAAGNVSVRAGEGIFFADIENGNAIIKIPNLLADKYEGLMVKYSGDNKYNDAFAEATVIVKPANSSVSAEDVNVSYGEAISIAVTSVNATEVSYKIIDNANKVVANGTVNPNGTINVSSLAAGDYTVNLTTVTDENHTSTSGSSKLHVRHVVTIVITPISGYAGEVVNFTAQFKYENGDPVNEGTAGLAIKYDDRQVLGASMYSILGADDTYSTKVSDGKATFNVKLGSPGTYPYVVTYSGDDVDAVQSESTVTILKLNTTVSGDDVSGKPSDEKSITINVLDQNNNAVNNGTVTLTLNGKTYNATVDNGKAVLNIELPNPGTYDATVKYNGNDYYSSSESSINVNVEKVNTNAPSAEDISGKAGEKTDISVEITDENGNPVKNGTATLTIDGKTYTAEVKNGVATFKDVELPEKDTVADVYYQGNDYYNSNSTTFSIKIKQDNNNTEPENNTDENPTEKHISSKAVDARATANPIAILVLTLSTLVITYRKK